MPSWKILWAAWVAWIWKLDQLLESAGVQLVKREWLANPEKSEQATLLLLTASGTQHNIDALVNAMEQQSRMLGPVKRMQMECLDRGAG
jgi:hypothetical protein